mmetsp:Transcript_2023/g.4996  ORF Transcript_2023/g.4996 Transcript_2023/m.4996 type:complete len:80 (-) Transcript_2023:88-327(-)
MHSGFPATCATMEMSGHNGVALTSGEIPAVDTTGCCLNLIDAMVDGNGIELMVCNMMMMPRRMRAATNIGIRGAISLIL